MAEALLTTREPALAAPTRSRAPSGMRSGRPAGGQAQRKEAEDKNELPAQLRNALEVGALDFLGYQGDVLERTILFFDTLRRRANNMLEHERAGLPPLLNFKYETLLDARHFERPVNCALLRITEVGEECWDDCVDPAKPPVIIIDPRGWARPRHGRT